MAKSVTIKIGADTKDFLEGLKKADKQINATQRTADNLAKSLKIEYSDAKFVQAQKNYQSALQQTEAKAQTLREKLNELEAAGKINTEDYARLELALARAEVKATDLKKKLDEVKNVDIDQLTKKFEDTGKKIADAGKSLAPFSLLAGGAIAGAVTLTKSAATLGAEIDDLSKQFGISTDTIQEWQYLAVQCGVNSNAFTKSLEKMRSAMTDLSTGTASKATNALSALGISPAQFKTQEEMFDGIVEALSRVKDSTLQTAYANDIFGDSLATQMLPYINAGTDTIKKFKDEFAAMPSLTSEQVTSLAELDETYTRLSISIQNATAQLGEAFAPLAERVVAFIEETVVPAIQKVAEWFEGLSPFMQDIILAGLGILALAAPTLMMIGKMSTGISALIKLFQSLNAAQLKTAAGFAAIAGAAALGINIISNWKNMSTVEKILKSLALAALVAAAAVTVFHASWSLGAMLGVIAASVAAGLGILNAAKDEILPEADDFKANVSSHGIDFNPDDYTIPQMSGSGNSYSTSNSSADVYNVNITIEGTNLSAEEIAEKVSKQIATLAQSRG